MELRIDKVTKLTIEKDNSYILYCWKWVLEAHSDGIVTTYKGNAHSYQEALNNAHDFSMKNLNKPILREDTWIDQQGRSHKIAEMKSSHLLNAIKMLERQEFFGSPAKNPDKWKRVSSMSDEEREEYKEKVKDALLHNIEYCVLLKEFKKRFKKGLKLQDILLAY